LSVAAPPPTAPPAGASPFPPVDAVCPLCGAPLDPRQEWCLSCGAAARTRLAAPTNWKAPIVAIAVIATLALGVLAAALVKLSGGSPAPTPVAPVTRTITTAAPIVPGSIPGSIPTNTTTTGATGANGASGLGGVAAPTTTGGAFTPGTPTTISPANTTTGGATATTTIPTGTTAPANTTPGSSTAAEEALRKAGFLPRAKK
jgi:hypothetical protein